MALGPQTITKNNEVDIKEIERIIDRCIKGATRRPVTISLDRLPGVYLVKEQIISLYKNAGWNEVVFVNDQRDGNFLLLK